MTTDHPDLIALRAAVLAAPADDVPRLMYADRLDELAGTVECVRRDAGWFGSRHVIPHPRPRKHSSAIVLCPDCSGSGRVPNGYAERAEFIRLQCEVGSRVQVVALLDSDPDRLYALRKREAELLERFADDDLAVEFGLPPHTTLYPMSGGYSVPGLGLGLLFRRGFVAHVTCPLAAWLGERCGCGGVGEWVEYSRTFRRCSRCRGTGYVGGAAAAVCGSQPVERVTLSDREPEHDGTPPGWIRADDELNDHGRPDALPPELYDLLTGGRALRDSVPWTGYPTRRAALDALSAAALSVGREWAGRVTARP